MKKLALLTFALLSSAALAAPNRPTLTAWLSQVQRFDTAKVAPHPRLLLTPPEIARVRAAAKSAEMAPYWAAVRKYVDAERNKPIPPDPPGFSDGKWNIEDWRRIVNVGGDAQNHILAAAFAWVVSQDPADLAEAKRWALGVARWNPNGSTGIEGVDHDSHDVLHALCLSYDWLYKEWTPEDRALLQANIAARTRALYKHLNPYRYDSWNNHAWFQTTAMVEGGLALLGDMDEKTQAEADTWWRYGTSLYFTEYLPLGGRDGDWHEGIHYVSYTLIFVYQWADALRTATGINAYDVPWLKKVTWFRLYANPPKSGGIKFNDNNYEKPDTWDRMTAANAARQAQDPALQWYALNISAGPPTNPLPALYTLIYRDLDLAPKAPGPDLPLGVWYRDSGWVVLRTDLARSDDIEFGLKAGPHLAENGSKGHDHPDQNGFLINAGAEPLAVDSGYYDYYGSPHHNLWTFTPQAHNTLLVDGQGQQIAPPVDSRVVSFVSFNGGMDFSESEAAPAYPAGLLNSWRRQVIFLRPDTFLIRDVVKQEKPATLTWLLHGPNKFALDGQSLSVVNKKMGLSGRIIAPTNLKLDQWGGYPKGAEPERKNPTDRPDEWHLTAETPEKVGDTVFLTVLKAGPAGTVKAPYPVPMGEAGNEMLGWNLGKNGEVRVLFATHPGVNTYEIMETLKTDASVVAFHTRGTEDAFLFSQCTTFSTGDRVIWRSTVPIDVSGIEEGAAVQSFNIRLPAAGRIRFECDPAPKSLTMDGKTVRPTYDKATRTVSLDLPEGMHEVRLK